MQAYLKIVGKKQGQIKGSSTRPGNQGSIMVVAVDHEIASQIDPYTGNSTGKRLHQPITIVKEIDGSSPLLYQLLVNNEVITQWELQFWSSSVGDDEEQYYTIKLTNATVVSIALHKIKPPTREDGLHELEEIKFAYQKIEWTFNDGGISASDNWEVTN
jgi:type VI secretion system secreted protein Hcp